MPFPKTHGRLLAGLSLLACGSAQAGDTPSMEELHRIILQQQQQLEEQQRQIEELRRLVGAGTTAKPDKARKDVREPRHTSEPTASLAARGQPGQAAKKPASEPEEKVEVRMKNGLRVRSADGDFALRLGGRLHTDAAWYDSDVRQFGDGAEIRRARIELSGRLFRDWGFRTAYDFADDEVNITDAYLSYRGFKPATIKLGQFQEPFSLEELTSSNDVTFMERALPNALVPGYHLGGGVSGYGDFGRMAWSGATGLFGEPVGTRSSDQVDDGWGVAGRFALAPVHAKERTLHFGASLEYREPNGDNVVSYRTSPETHVANISLVNTGDIADVRHTLTYGLEGAWVMGPFSLQGEYIGTDLQRDGLSDLRFDGWYGYGSWFLTGESRPYDSRRGVFRRIKPKHKYGAWELALRYSTLDLTDRDIEGGKERNLTVGLNWYPNQNLRFMANYIRVDTDPSRDGVSDDPDLFQIRGQVRF